MVAGDLPWFGDHADCLEFQHSRRLVARFLGPKVTRANVNHSLDSAELNTDPHVNW